MKRSQAFPGNFLGKDDVPSPITAIIEDVTREAVKCEHGEEHKPIMHFSDLKPLILNNVNWFACEDAYGLESDDWRGKPVEIYVDPSVMFGQKRVGGIRLRVPAKPLNGQRNVAAIAQPATAALPAPPKLEARPNPQDERKALLTNGYRKALTAEKVEEWRAWAVKFEWDDQNGAEMDAERKAALRRIASAPQTNGRPVKQTA